MPATLEAPDAVITPGAVPAEPAATEPVVAVPAAAEPGAEPSTAPAEPAKEPEKWELVLPDEVPPEGAQTGEPPATVKELLEAAALKDAIAKDPALRERIEVLGGRAQLADEFEQHFETPRAAGEAKVDAGTLRHIDEIVYAKEPSGAQVAELLDLLMWQRDEKGDYVRPHPASAPLATPAYVQIAQHNINGFLDAMGSEAKGASNVELAEAVDVLRKEFAKSVVKPGQVAAASRAQAGAATAVGRVAQPAATDPQRQKAVDAFYTDLVDATVSGVIEEAVKAGEKLNFAPPVKRMIAADVQRKIDLLLESDKVFQAAQQNVLKQYGLTKQGRDAALALHLRWARSKMAAAYEDVARNFNAGVAQHARQKQDTTAAQAQRKEPRGGSPGARPIGTDLNALVDAEDKRRREAGKPAMTTGELLDFTAQHHPGRRK